ncbi:hypothetical protein KM043_000421 [Ampulex compressa]|nr:hypothetical protein KM043_000421 [Ampulex compressa]
MAAKRARDVGRAGAMQGRCAFRRPLVRIWYDADVPSIYLVQRPPPWSRPTPTYAADSAGDAPRAGEEGGPRSLARWAPVAVASAGGPGARAGLPSGGEGERALVGAARQGVEGVEHRQGAPE